MLPASPPDSNSVHVFKVLDNVPSGVNSPDLTPCFSLQIHCEPDQDKVVTEDE